MKSWLRDNDIEVYSPHNEEKYIFAVRFTRALNNMTSVSKNVYIDELEDIGNKYNNNISHNNQNEA